MTQNNTNTDTTAKIINYKELPPALRLVAAHSAVDQIKAGIKRSVVAKAFGTTQAHINIWVKCDKAGTLGAHMQSDKDADPIDWRVLTTDLRLAGRTKIVSEVKEGNEIEKVAKRYGTTKLSIQRWVDMDSKGDTGYHKRGRKVGQVAKSKGKKRGRKVGQYGAKRMAEMAMLASPEFNI